MELNIFDIFGLKFSSGEVLELIAAISRYRDSKNPETQIKKSVYAILEIMNQNVAKWYADFNEVFNTNQVKGVSEGNLSDELLKTYKDKMSEFEGSNEYTLIANSVLSFLESKKSALADTIEEEQRRKNVIKILEDMRKYQNQFYNIARKKKEIFVEDHILEQEKDEPLISAYDIFGAKKRLRDLNLRISGKIIALLDEAHIDIGFHEIVSFIDEMRNSHQTGKIGKETDKR